jgi:hypothetical protein
MAILKQVAKVATKVATVAKPVAKVATKVATKPVAKDGLTIFSMDNIELVPKAGGGGGKSLSPFSEAVFSLEIGQGIKISDEKYNAGKGVASVYAGAKRRNIKLRVRRDTTGQLWLFRVAPKETEETTEE